MSISSPEELTVGLYERGVIGYATTDDSDMIGRPGGFKTLKSGRISPTYVNTRGLTSFSSESQMPRDEQEMLRELVLSTYGELIDEDPRPYDHLLGIPHAMTALGAMIGLRRQDSVLSMRTQSKAHGISKLIEGDYSAGEEVVALDDVVTDGLSKFETVEGVTAAGLRLSRFRVLVDREEGGKQTMEEAGLEISSALAMGGITAILAEQGLINERQIDWTAQYYQKLVDERLIGQIPPDLAAIL